MQLLQHENPALVINISGTSKRCFEEGLFVFKICVNPKLNYIYPLQNGNPAHRLPEKFQIRLKFWQKAEKKIDIEKVNSYHLKTKVCDNGILKDRHVVSLLAMTKLFYTPFRKYF